MIKNTPYPSNQHLHPLLLYNDDKPLYQLTIKHDKLFTIN